MARKPATPTSKTTGDSLQSLVKDYFETRDQKARGLLSDPNGQKVNLIERKIRSEVGLPPPLANRTGT